MLSLDPQPPGDRALRDAILAGDPHAAERFLRGHLDDLYQFVHYRAGGRRALVEDVVQETFLTAFERMASYDGEAGLGAWLRGIARNKIREERRRRRPKPLEDVLEEAGPEIDAILASIEREPLPDWALEQRETRELVGATLSSLPADYRDALLSKYVDGLSVAQLAERAGKGEKAAESMLHRARLAFSRVFTLLAKRRGELE